MSDSLSAIWAEIAAGTARGYARDLAASAGASEAQLVAAGIGNGVVRLEVDWMESLPRLEELGEVKVITRNNSIVHEKVGTFGSINIVQTTGLVLNGNVDLRIFFGHWHHTFLVTSQGSRGPRTAIQVFDLHGNAVHKIYRTAATDAAAWERFTGAFIAADQTPGLEVLPPLQLPAPRADEAVDVNGLRGHWQKLKDVHHFHDMLAQFGVSRLQAMHLAGAPWTREVPADALSRILSKAAAGNVPFMVFVGNPGCIQIHTGAVGNVVERDGWTNVMDPNFTLHVKNAEIASAWVVRKPSRDCAITTLELYDVRGENCAILCGQRAPSEPERADWVGLLDGLPSVGAAAA
jgi:Putative heme degradation protein